MEVQTGLDAETAADTSRILQTKTGKLQTANNLMGTANYERRSPIYRPTDLPFK